MALSFVQSTRESRALFQLAYSSPSRLVLRTFSDHALRALRLASSWIRLGSPLAITRSRQADCASVDAFMNGTRANEQANASATLRMNVLPDFVL